MCTEGMVCKGEMNTVIRIHTGNNSKSEWTTNSTVIPKVQ